MDHSRYAQLCYGSDDDLEDDAQSATTYYEVEDDIIEVNDDEYWDAYFEVEDYTQT
jgi:hypothetical protein